MCSKIHQFIGSTGDDKFHIRQNRSLLLTNAFFENTDKNFKNTYEDFDSNSDFSLFINQIYVKYFESLPSEYSIKPLQDFKKDIFERFNWESNQDKTHLTYSNKDELKFFQAFSKLLICTDLGSKTREFNFLPGRSRGPFRARDILREFRVNNIKQFFNSLSLTQQEDLHRSYFESDAWSDELFDLIAENINLEEYFTESMLGPKGPRSPRTYSRRSTMPELREDVMGFLTKSLSDDLLYHLDEKNKYNIAELSTEMLSKFESVFLTETEEICTKYNLFLDKSIVDDEDRKLELFELFLSSVSEEIVNKYYENIEGEVQKVFAHWILTIALPTGTGMRTRSSWNYISRCLSLFSSAALNDEINETQNFLDLNNIVLLNEDLIISSINPQKKLISSLSCEKFCFLNSTRQAQVTNYLVSEKLAPIGINGEFLSRFIFLYGKDKYNAPTPPNNITKVPTSPRELYESKSSISLIDHLNSWLSYIFNLENVSVDYDEQSNQIKINQDSLINVGSGINQVLGILVLLIISSDDNSQTTIFLEEVEQNLHTSAQSKLADTLLIFSSHPTTRVVVETHSDHIVNRLRIKSIKGTKYFGTSDYNLYFATLDNDNGTKLNEMKINSKGEFDSSIIPPGFFDQYHKDTIQILEALADKEKEEEQDGSD